MGRLSSVGSGNRYSSLGSLQSLGSLGSLVSLGSLQCLGSLHCLGTLGSFGSLAALVVWARLSSQAGWDGWVVSERQYSGRMVAKNYHLLTD